ncbi:hypothetical protein B0T26DRAFT_707503 [Lasiosphaeria miniovina]|uniref:F-box domain-containing protein n=1 Tax=Lasiosphaeria miniovina TaxID=1954250 RepID=A0AA40AJF3_9PEZI|nr:uncharacterized protein B0T26DRAFT_707503 [Lasiosphaeria miniovina]KAK0716860.1 hypothetical protein B0T26DRAFT_707503 [Lasiosphaeria miniovina]
MAGVPQTRRRQPVLDRLTAFLPSSQILRRWWKGGPVLNSDADADAANTKERKPWPAAAAAQEDSPDADAPVALLLPGMAGLTVSSGAAQSRLANLPIAGHKSRSRALSVHKASRQPDLFLTMLPIEIQQAIFALPNLSLFDLLSLRKTCRTLRCTLPIGVMERKLKEQNHAGWSVVFEMHGHKYPGTTYGNRRLCGRCVVPKITGHLIQGAAVRDYLIARRGLRSSLVNTQEEGEEEDDGEWPEERAMCFPCLRTELLLANKTQTDGAMVLLEAPPGAEMYKLAAISTEERFPMLDGTTRKMCKGCARDIHENAVPCPHCVDFSEWCRTRRRHA